jgi:hypothetical protein
MVYLISYDAHARTEAFYVDLANKLHAAGARRILLSEWILSTSSTAEQVRLWVSGLIAINTAADRVLVIEIGRAWSSTNAMADGISLLNVHRP